MFQTDHTKAYNSDTLTIVSYTNIKINKKAQEAVEFSLIKKRGPDAP